MPYKGVLIIGKDPINHKQLEIEEYSSNPDEYLIIDCSDHEITSQELREKLGHGAIGPNTRIDILAHGGIEERPEFGINHIISLLSDIPYTKDVLAVISEQGEGTPIQAHLWSCYAGTAAKAVETLPCGSIVLGHGPEKSVTYITTNKESIKKSVKKSIENGNYGMSSLAQDMVDNSMEYSLQDMSFGVKTSDGIVLTRTINLFAETINIEGYDQAVTKIEAYLSDTIESLKLTGSLIEDIKSPVLRTHGVEEISQFRKERIRYNILRIDENKVDFEKLMKEKRLITPNDPEYESLNREERSMLEPAIQNELLEIFTHDIDYFSYSAKSKENLIDYLIEIAKSKDDGDIYLARLFDHATDEQKPLVIEAFNNINTPDIDGFTVLNKVIAKKDIALADHIIRTKNPLLTKNEEIEYLILKRNYYGASNIIKEGFDLHKANSRGRTLFEVGAPNEIINLLLEHGQDISPDIEGNTRLHLISRYNGKNVLLGTMSSLANDMNTPNSLGKTPLHYACEYSTEVAKLLINNGADLNTQDSSGKTPLHYTLDGNLIHEMLSKGAILGEARDDGKNELHLAVQFSDENTITNLIAIGVDINQVAKTGETPLDTAIKNNKFALAKILLNNGAQLSNGQHFIDYTLQQGNKHLLPLAFETAEQTLKNIEDLENSGRDALLYSSIHHSAEWSKILLEKGVDPNITFQGSTTPVIFGFVHEGFTQMTEEEVKKFTFFLKAGADVNSTDQLGNSLLELLIDKRPPNLEMIKLAVEKGANLEKKDRRGISIGEKIISRNNPELLKICLEAMTEENKSSYIKTHKKAILLQSARSPEEYSQIIKDNAQHFTKEDMLLLAIYNNDLSKVHESIDSGVSLTPTDDYNPLKEAFSYNKSIARMLYKNGAEISLDLFNKDSFEAPITDPAHLLLRFCDSELVEKMISNGTNLNTKDSLGRTFLEIAIQNNNYEGVSALLDKGAKLSNEKNLVVLAVESQNNKLLQIAVEKGMDLDNVLIRGKNLEQIASRGWDWGLKEILAQEKSKKSASSVTIGNTMRETFESKSTTIALSNIPTIPNSSNSRKM